MNKIIILLTIIATWTLAVFGVTMKETKTIKPKKIVVKKHKVKHHHQKKHREWTRLTHVSAYSYGDATGSSYTDSESKPVHVGLVAVGHGLFKRLYGKVIRIRQFPGRTFQVTDKMGKDRDIDVYMNSVHRASSWGVRGADIKIVGNVTVHNWKHCSKWK